MQCLIRGRPSCGNHGGQLADHDLDPPPSRATQGGPQREAPTCVMAYLGGLGCMERDARGVHARDEGCRTFPRPWRASKMIAQGKPREPPSPDWTAIITSTLLAVEVAYNSGGLKGCYGINGGKASDWVV